MEDNNIINEAAHEWVFEKNGEKWSNNDDTAGDNFSSFIAGAKWMLEKIDEEKNEELQKMIKVFGKELKDNN